MLDNKRKVEVNYVRTLPEGDNKKASAGFYYSIGGFCILCISYDDFKKVYVPVIGAAILMMTLRPCQEEAIIRIAVFYLPNAVINVCPGR